MSKSPGWIQAIQELLRDGLAVPDTELREDARGSTCKPVTIHRYGKNIVLSFNAKISLTKKGDLVCVKDRLFPLFHEHEGVTRMSDYWLFWETADDVPVLHVLLCELKSGKPDGAYAQIDNARLLAEYVVKMAEHHCRLGPINAQYRGIVFCKEGLLFKPGLRPGKLPYSPRGRLQVPVVALRDGAEYSLPNLCT